MFRNRETMIALRARRKSFAIASKVAQPPVDPPPRPPADAPAPDPHARAGRIDQYTCGDDADPNVGWLILLGLAFAVFFVVILYV